MMPIEDLLGRIRWDLAFGQARFEIAYYDRVARTLVRVPLENVSLAEAAHYFLDVVASDGVAHSVPLHRVRAVWRDGDLVWQCDRQPA
ncbi:MAG TPA: DUF504 domain-containing protein [Casimicrobiaceae bacterium]|nr:DUF504 domain-containing protein [Casimicrobiaceae bacterium]